MYYPTSGRVIPCLMNIHASFNAYSNYQVFTNALIAMKTKFDKYWETFPTMFWFATIMDPRYKLFAIGEQLRAIGKEQLEINKTISSLRDLLFELHEHYKKTIAPTVAPNVQNTSSSLQTMTHDFFNLSTIEDFANRCLKKAKVSTSSSTTTSNLQYYLDLPTIEVDDDGSFSVLGWWKSLETIYPILSLIFRDLLIIPASTIPSNAVFSADSRVVSEKRANLNPNTIEALICLKD